MISFRFHVVSITAIFLAIAIGVVVGSTYVDGAVVDGLRSQINRVSDDLDARKAENDALDNDLGTARDYIEATDEFAVTDRLTDVPVLLVATRGIDESTVEEVALLARGAGALVPGVVWLESRWSLAADDDRAALAEIVGGRADDAAEELWGSAWEAVVLELTTEPVTDPGIIGSTTTVAPDVPTDVLAALEAAAFLSVDSLDDASSNLADLAGANPGVVVLTGARAQEELVPMVPFVVAAPVQGGLPTVVADVHVDAPEAVGRGEALVDALAPELRDAIIIVDDADLPEGRVTTVLALDSASAQLNVGSHFGYGDGADLVLPAWTPP
jgi:outer membrane murein-binding lipoprotein Lpp